MSHIALADRLLAAIEAGDRDAIAACYAPGARIWHNFDGVEQTVADNLATLAWLDKRLFDRKYEIVARYEIEGGYVQQHVLHGRLADGGAFSMPACLIVQVENGRIVRLDEYLDTGQAAALRLRSAP